MEIFRNLGATPVVVPLLEFQSTLTDDQFFTEWGNTNTGDWVLFTSANGVRAFFLHFRAKGWDARGLYGKKVGAIGPATATELRKEGILADLVSDVFEGEAFANALMKRLGTERPGVHLYRAKKAREVLPQTLRDAGLGVHVVAIYETVAPREASAALLEELRVGPDAIGFTSPSTVEHFVKLVGSAESRTVSERIPCFAIGPVTSEAMKAASLGKAGEAATFELSGLAEAMIAYFADRQR
ncbi:MAG: uroporphyrinogen-III synthase [Polyangiaceae bacterium]|nr:uroporphyrinogen-III synthase [Polyangiaceae bacterium]